MLNRRKLVLALSVFPICRVAFAQSATPRHDSFDSLLQSVRGNPALLDPTRTLREGAKDNFEYYVSKAVAPRPNPSLRKISERAMDLIATFEITSEQRYERDYRHPIWPSGDSGVTVGVGYDLGYVTTGWLNTDWGGIATPEAIAKLRGACGLKGAAAQNRLKEFATVEVPWPLAQQQFRERLLPLYIAETLARLPNAGNLSDDSLGAVVSLVYNRGGNFQSLHPSRAEMRQIYQAMQDKDYSKVPNYLRSMKHLWAGKPNMRGLLERRELEARLFEAGLAA